MFSHFSFFFPATHSSTMCLSIVFTILRDVVPPNVVHIRAISAAGLSAVSLSFALTGLTLCGLSRVITYTAPARITAVAPRSIKRLPVDCISKSPIGIREILSPLPMTVKLGHDNHLDRARQRAGHAHIAAPRRLPKFRVIDALSNFDRFR